MRDILMLALLLLGASFLPPDTSLQERRAQGVLRFCVGDPGSALIAAADGSPGPELQMMQKVAQDMQLKLQLVQIVNMGRSFNPSDWHISRGQCDILGGGLSDSAVNRGFLTMVPNGGQIGLRLFGADALPIGAAEVGVFIGSSGLDRVRLSRWMRNQGWRAKPLQNVESLTSWLASGKPAIASTLTGLPAEIPSVALPAPAAESSQLGFGLWRGDVTLTRAVRKFLPAPPENIVQ